ncbi:MAG: DUF4215 domain-containing protein [Kofleriaceae bacterium]|nr:DUF4215 domain-containing protein [Kofleriaceae bacterium]
MRLGFAVSTFLAIVLAPIAAHADTVIAGGNLSTQTWTASNSPYIVQGDITVIAGATLTIDPGVVVKAAANSDSQLAGRSTSRVEITVAGSLVANGTTAQPITFQSTTTSSGSWYGVVALAGATQVKLDHVDIQNATYGVTAETTGTELQLTNSSVTASSSYGLWLRAGTPTVNAVNVVSSGTYGVYVTDSASPTLMKSVVRNSGNAGVYIVHSTPGRSVTVANCTLNANGSYGIITGASSANVATVTVKNSIITSSSYGIYKSDSASWSVTNSNIWNNTGENTHLITVGANMISANPLYVSASDLRLTSNSPSRFGSDVANEDQGALPYDGVATPGLYGVLWANTTLLAATGNYTAAGDLSVAPGVTLTIEPGVTLTFASSSDIMLAGQSTSRGELIVRGTLVANGTAANPITIGSTSTSSGSWYGVELESTSHDSVLDDLTIRHATYGVQYLSTGTGNQLSNLVVESSSSYGLWLRAGSPNLDAVSSISSGTYGVYVTDSASPTLTRCIVRNSGNAGIYIVHSTPGKSVTVSRSTLNANGSYGIITGASSANVATVSVVGSIITSTSYGVYKSDSASWSVSSSNIWNNTSENTHLITLGANMISANPLYVSASDLRLTSNSPSRFGAPGNEDQGALPYDGVATPGLYGVLWTNRTLTAAGGPYTASGDLTVGPNVTLTIDAGVTLTFTSSSDIMLAGQSTSRGELTVRGTLVADGTPANPITIGSTSTSSGSWYGVDMDTTAHATVLDNVVIRHATYGLQYRSTGTGNQLTRLTIESASSYGAYLRAGNPVLSGATIFSTGTYGVYVTDSASPQLVNTVVRNSGNAGVYIVHGTPGRSVTITNCSLNANGSYGVITGASSANVATVTITNSLITSSSYGVYKSDSASWSVSYSDIWNNTSENAHLVTLGAGMLSANPQYVSTADLHVMGTSVAIDAGTTGPSDDLEGHARPLDGNGVGGPQWDMGAYEYISMIQCGNGAVEGTETCDDGAMNGTYGHCNAQCNGLGPRCGDGTMNGPEQCDDGNASNTDSCLNTCQNPTCGDGFVRAGVEQCDDSNSSNTDACLDTCMTATCGDGFVRAGVEACDDGNQSNSDACLSSCVVATCGDGFTQTGVEQCDDGNMSNTDACLNVCHTATCGDGFQQTGVEGCDDGNMVDTDMCSNLCVSSSCGNGMVEGSEQCDDGNKVESDMCRNNCVDARCGDGVIAGGVEECDDGNTDPGDGCDELCATEGGEEPMPTNPDGGGGCCDSSTRGGELGSLFLASLVLVGLGRRRRNRR